MVCPYVFPYSLQYIHIFSIFFHLSHCLIHIKLIIFRVFHRVNSPGPTLRLCPKNVLRTVGHWAQRLDFMPASLRHGSWPLEPMELGDLRRFSTAMCDEGNLGSEATAKELSGSLKP